MTKKIFYLFLFLSINTFSQEITFVPITTTLSDSLNSEIIFYINLTNVSNEPQTVFVLRTVNELPEGWTSSLCFEFCFAPFVDSIATVDDPPFFSSPLSPGETRSVSLHVFTTDNPGTANVQVQAGTFNNPSDKITIDFTANAGPTSINDEGKNPNNFILNQNFPNPFNPITVISYQLAVDSKVNLIVYDILGNEVAVLVNEFKSAGSHSVVFSKESLRDGSNLSSGVYFYQLKAVGNSGQNFISTKKMLINK